MITNDVSDQLTGYFLEWRSVVRLEISNVMIMKDLMENSLAILSRKLGLPCITR